MKRKASSWRIPHSTAIDEMSEKHLSKLDDEKDEKGEAKRRLARSN